MAQAIIVPLDGSEQAERALPWGALLARLQGLRLVLLRVVPVPVEAYVPGASVVMTGEIYDRLQADERAVATGYLEAVRHRLSEQPLTIDTIVRVGAAAQHILDVANEQGAAIVVMTTHGRGGLARLALGSVAESVVQQIALPLLLVREGPTGADAPPALSRVLVPLDGSSLAARALDLARAVATEGARLILVRVVSPVERLREGIGVPTVYIAQDATQDEAEQAKRYLERVAETIPADRFSVETDVRIGRAADEIQLAARERSAQLIVLSTHGRTGPERWLLGSVADEVVRHATVPVLLASARALAARAADTATAE